MKNQIIKVIAAALSTFFVYGCALTNEMVEMKYTPDKYVDHQPSDKEIHVERLKDVRGLAPKLITYKGITERIGGEFINNVEISEFLSVSLEELFPEMGYKLTSDENGLLLAGEILKFESNVITGLWDLSIESIIQLNLKLLNGEDGSILWNETVVGSGKQSGIQLANWKNREAGYYFAMDDLMKNISSSVSLKRAISKY